MKKFILLILLILGMLVINAQSVQRNGLLILSGSDTVYINPKASSYPNWNPYEDTTYFGATQIVKFDSLYYGMEAGQGITITGRYNNVVSVENLPNESIGSLTYVPEHISSILTGSQQVYVNSGDSVYYIAGYFNAGSGNRRIGRFRADGTIDQTFMTNLGTDFNSSINGIAEQPDGKIICAGQYTEINGTPYNRLVRLNPDGTIDGTFDIGTGSDGTIRTVKLDSDGNVWIAGSFNNYDGTAVSRLAKLSSIGALDATFVNAGFNADVVQIIPISDDRIVAAGYFSTYNSLSAGRFICLNYDGTENTAYNTNVGTGFSDYLTGLSRYMGTDTVVYILNDINETYNGSDIDNIGRIKEDGTIDNTFRNNMRYFGQFPRNIHVDVDGKILVGGDYYTYDDKNVPNLLRFNANGSLDDSFALQGRIETSTTMVGELGINYIIGGQINDYQNIQTSPLAIFTKTGELLAKNKKEYFIEDSLLKMAPLLPYFYESDMLTDKAYVDNKITGVFTSDKLFIENGQISIGESNHRLNSSIFIGDDIAVNMFTNGDNDVIIGNYSGNLYNNGSNNTIMGGYAASYMTAGSDNTIIGAWTAQGLKSGGNSNTVIGNSSMSYGHGDNDNNVAIGDGALTGEWEPSLDSDGNIAIGNSSLYNGFGHDNSIAIGNSAMYGKNTSTENDENIVIGSSAGRNMELTNQYNILLGYRSGYYLDDYTNYNIAMGANSFYDPEINAEHNIAIGYNSLRTAKDTGTVAIGVESMHFQNGRDNTAVGEFTMQGTVLSEGNDNAAFGSFALTDLSTGDENTSVGKSSGYLLTTGNQNTFVGLGSGYSIVSGNQNTFLGNRAGYGVTGSGNVMLGYNVGGSLGALSNQLWIDNSNTTDPLIEGDFSTDELIINGNLTVTGTVTDGGPAPISYTFGNGLTETAGAVGLGGTLTSDVAIIGAYNVDFGNPSFRLNTFDLTVSGQINLLTWDRIYLGTDNDIELAGYKGINLSASTEDISILAGVDKTLLLSTPTGTVDDAVANVAYVNSAISGIDISTPYFSGSLTDGSPLLSEIAAILGFDANSVSAGYKAYVKDTDGTAVMYSIVSDGTDWYIEVLNKLTN
jgi:uncharacterized delta-60 repeat protein